MRPSYLHNADPYTGKPVSYIETTARVPGQYKDEKFPIMGIPMLNVRRRWNRLIFIATIHGLVRRHFDIEGQFSFHGRPMSEAMGEYVMHVIGPVELDIVSQVD